MVKYHDKKNKYKVVKHTVAGIFAILLLMLVTLFVLESNLKDVNLYFNGRVYAARTFETTISGFIEDNNIPFNDEHDYINVDVNNKLKDETNTIDIKTAIKVEVICDGKTQEVMTYKDTVKEVLEDMNIKIYENDKLLNIELDTKVSNSQVIEIVRVTKGVEVTKKTLQNYVELVENDTMALNEQKILEPGRLGEKTYVYEIVYENGIEVSRELTLEEITIKPKNLIVEVGVIPFKIDPNTGKTFKYLESEIFVATAYTLDPSECGGKEPGDAAYGITASGMKADVGIIAVDKNVIPFGTKLYIETITGEHVNYGFAIAGDIGSAIKGNRLDLFMHEKQAALEWGIRKVRVYFIYED